MKTIEIRLQLGRRQRTFDQVQGDRFRVAVGPASVVDSATLKGSPYIILKGSPYIILKGSPYIILKGSPYIEGGRAPVDAASCSQRSPSVSRCAARAAALASTRCRRIES